MRNTKYFFVGTTAELIKLLPVMIECRNRGLNWKIIASGQNDIRDSELFSTFDLPRPHVVLYSGKIRQTPLGLLTWFAGTLLGSVLALKREFGSANRRTSVLIVHGDTVSTVMGALFGFLYRIPVAHVEAGLRSFNYLHPFPEEIDRVITSRLASMHFCPNEWALGNLTGRSGLKVNTHQNTLAESIQLARDHPVKSLVINELHGQRFFVFVMHRQENLFNEKLVIFLLNRIRNLARQIHCVFVMHEPTKSRLESLGLLTEIQGDTSITLTPRLPYIEFMQVLDASEFMVTDGGSNQEESYYMGKPCLILREATERIEGLDANVVLSKNSETVINDFLEDPEKYRKLPAKFDARPSAIIVDSLLAH